MKIKLFNHIIETSFDIYKIKNDDFFYEKEEIAKIIDYPLDQLESITISPMLNKKWELCFNGKYVSFDRIKIDDRNEYDPYQISSYRNEQDKLYIGEKNELTFIMAYNECYGWDSAQVFIFDNNLQTIN